MVAGREDVGEGEVVEDRAARRLEVRLHVPPRVRFLAGKWRLKSSDLRERFVRPSWWFKSCLEPALRTSSWSLGLRSWRVRGGGGGSDLRPVAVEGGVSRGDFFPPAAPEEGLADELGVVAGSEGELQPDGSDEKGVRDGLAHFVSTVMKINRYFVREIRARPLLRVWNDVLLPVLCPLQRPPERVLLPQHHKLMLVRNVPPH
jgi:hypothetical protein